MAEHTVTGTIAAPADEVWAQIRDFTGGSWIGLEMETEGEGEGATRTMSMGAGSLTELCERLDDDARVMGYTITVGEGLPFRDYHSTMTVNDADEGTEVVWSATYEPVGDPEVARQTLDAIYGGGLKGLKRHFE